MRAQVQCHATSHTRRSGGGGGGGGGRAVGYTPRPAGPPHPRFPLACFDASFEGCIQVQAPCADGLTQARWRSRGLCICADRGIEAAAACGSLLNLRRSAHCHRRAAAEGRRRGAGCRGPWRPRPLEAPGPPPPRVAAAVDESRGAQPGGCRRRTESGHQPISAAPFAAL